MNARSSGIMFLMLLVGCNGRSSNEIVEFSATDVSQSARWANSILKSINDRADISNDIARRVANEKDLPQIEALLGNLKGTQVTWTMNCGVSETVITLLPNKFRADGREFLRVARSTEPLTLLIVDDRPTTDSRGRKIHEDETDRYFQLRVPDQIDRSVAAGLPEKVKMNGRIKSIEIEKYEDDSYQERHYICVTLTDVKLTPDLE